MAMCVAMTFMAITILQSILLVSPDEIIDSVNSIYNWAIYAWNGMLGLIARFHIARLVCYAFIIKKMHPKLAIFPFLARADT